MGTGAREPWSGESLAPRDDELDAQGAAAFEAEMIPAAETLEGQQLVGAEVAQETEPTSSRGLSSSYDPEPEPEPTAAEIPLDAEELAGYLSLLNRPCIYTFDSSGASLKFGGTVFMKPTTLEVLAEAWEYFGPVEGRESAHR